MANITASFTRNSVAYLSDGTQVRANVPRFEVGKFGQAVMVEEGTTNVVADPSFENADITANWNAASASNWAYTGTARVRDTTYKKYGTASVKCGNGAQSGKGIAEKNQGTAAHAVSAGQVWTLSFDVYATNAGTQYIALIRCYDSAGANISDSVTPPSGWLYSPHYAALYFFTTVPGANAWYRITKQFTVPTGVAYVAISLQYYTGGDYYVWLDGIQFENKAYASSFIDGTRSPETLTIPTAGVLNPQEGTVECWLNPYALSRNMYIGIGGSRYINVTEDRNSYNIWYDGILRVGWGYGTGIYIVGKAFSAKDTWTAIAVTWKANDSLKLFINGTLAASISIGALNPSFPYQKIFIGCSSRGGWQADALIDDLRISNKARTDAEIAAAYASGQPLPIDQYTTLKLDFDGTLRYKTGEFKVYHNTPDVGYIQWQDLDIRYKGITYNIPDGYTGKKFVWWDYDYPYQLQATDTVPENMTDDDLLVFLNKNGTAVVVPKSTIVPGDLIVPGSILADHLSANCVTSEKILAGAISSNHIAANAIGAVHIAAGAIATEHIAAAGLDAKVIKTGELDAMKVDVVGKDRMVRLVGDGMVVYDREGGEAARLGYYETLGDQVASFSRNSAAYTSDGRQVASGQERYEWTRLPYPVWQDTFDTDQLSQYTSGGDSSATWSVSNGVLSGTGGLQATLVKNDLYLQDCEIVINTDRAGNGGIVARYQDNNNYYLLAVHDDSGDISGSNLRLFKRVNGTFTQLSIVDLTWTRGTSKQVRLVLNGSKIEAYFDGVKVISVTDTTFTGGQVGLRNSSATAFRVLDFTVYYAVQGAMSEEGTTNYVISPKTQKNIVSPSSGYTQYDYQHNHPYGGVPQSQAITYAVSFELKQRGTYPFGSVVLGGGAGGDAWNIRIRRDLTLQGTGVSGSVTTKPLADGWKRYECVFTVPTTGYLQTFVKFIAEYGTGAVDSDIRNVQLEQKPYATSFIDGTRSPEVLTVPTAGVFTRGSWTVKLRFTPTTARTARNFVLWSLYIDANNYLTLYTSSSGHLTIDGKSNGTHFFVASAAGYVVLGNTYHIAVAGNGSTLYLFCNGTQIGSTSYSEPVGTLPTSMGVGSYATGGTEANGLVSDFAVMSKAQTLAEHQAEYQTGRPLLVDDYTTLLMSMDGTLKPTVKRLGLRLVGGVVETDAFIVDRAAGQAVDMLDGFGDGSDGVFNSTGNVTWTVPTEDVSMIVKRFTSFTLNAGHTLTVDKRCRGVYIFCRGDVVINGTIDLSGKSALVGPLKASTYKLQIPVGITVLEVPVGGAGGAGGAGGNSSAYGSTTYGGTGGPGTCGLFFGGGWGGGGGGGVGGAVVGSSSAYGGSGGAGGYNDPDAGLGNGGAGGAGVRVSSGIAPGNPGMSGGNLAGGGGGSGAVEGASPLPPRYSGSGGSGNRGGGGGGGAADISRGSGQNGFPGGTDLPAGGGTIVIVAKGSITIGSSGIIRCNGANGARGGAGGQCTTTTSSYYLYGGSGGGGSGGGGGGVVVLAYRGNYTNNGTIQVNGGTGGSGGAGGPANGNYTYAGNPGNAGANGSVGTIVVMRI